MLLLMCAAVVAVGGCVVLGGSNPPPEQAQSQQGADVTHLRTTSVAAPSPSLPSGQSAKFTAYPGYNPDPCYNAGDKDAADLCAQWRAAMAAEKAAYEAKRATSWSIVTTLLNGLSLIAVSAALFLTVQSNRIARETMKRSLRGYLTVTNFKISGFRPNTPLVLDAEVVNGGATPAQVLEWSYTANILYDPIDEAVFSIPIMPNPPTRSTVGPGGNVKLHIPTHALMYNDFLKLSSGYGVLYFWGKIKYKDIFGDHYETVYRYRFDPKVNSIVPTHAGNYST
jgi:hypothetical protein